MNDYTFGTTVDAPFDEVVESTIEALSAEGFGVLCDLDVRRKFLEALDEEFRRYRVLGACNPPLAHDALAEERALGALLPCNVIVYEADSGAVRVRAVDPEELLSVVENHALDPIAAEVRDRLERAVDSVAAAAADG